MGFLLWTAGYFVISVMGYVILSRSVAGNGVFKFMVAGSLAGAMLILHASKTLPLALTVGAVLLYALFCELFIFFITFVRSSVSVSLLLMLKNRSLSDTEIDNLYRDEAMVDGRINKLAKAGFLRDDGKALTTSGKSLLSGFRFFRRFFRHEGVERTLQK